MVTNDLPLRDEELDVTRDEAERKRPVADADGTDGTQPYSTDSDGTDGDSDGTDGDSDGTDGDSDGTDGDSDGTDGDSDGSDA